MIKDEFYFQALEHLSGGNFIYCCMKLRTCDGSMPTTFGVIKPENPCRIHLMVRDEGGKPVFGEEFVEFGSIEALLEAGWDVD